MVYGVGLEPVVDYLDVLFAPAEEIVMGHVKCFSPLRGLR